MKKFLSALCVTALSLLVYGQDGHPSSISGNRRNFSFAWLTDVHLNSFAYAEDDLRQAVEDINANPDVDFTILSGDVTEFGDTKEFQLLEEILKGFRKPYLLLPGNHDVNWSENGCTMFDKIFRASHFCYDWQGVRFVGCGAGPSLRMGPPHIPREEILWLDSVYNATPAAQPVIFVNHFPLNADLSNCREVLRILKTRNTQAVLAGHLHVNRSYDADGIPGVIGRSSLRRKDLIGGYNLVSLKGDTLLFRERIIKTETRPAWDTIVFHPAIREVWTVKDVTDIASQGSIDGNLYIYTNTAGVVCALDAGSGKTLWKYRTGNKIFSAPFITPQLVIVSSCDGCVYALNRQDGSMRWKYDTGYPIVACPTVADDTVYIGSSNGKFYSINPADGTVNWICEGLKGYIESRPATDRERVYTGTWGAMFYAIDRKTGKKVWEFDTRRGRYFSPGACWPVVLPYTANGGSNRNRLSYSVPTISYALSSRRQERFSGLRTKPKGANRSVSHRMERRCTSKASRTTSPRQIFQKAFTHRFGIPQCLTKATLSLPVWRRRNNTCSFPRSSGLSTPYEPTEAEYPGSGKWLIRQSPP